MLTLKDINEASFGKSNFAGYRPEDVDAFLDEVAESYKKLLDEKDTSQKKVAELTAKNSELQEKLSVLAKRVDSYRKDEEGIKEALFSAQKISTSSITEAKQRAETIVTEAETKARTMTENAKREAETAVRELETKTEQKKLELEKAKESVAAFKTRMLDMYKQHLDHIENIPIEIEKEHLAQDKALETAKERSTKPVQSAVKPESSTLEEKKDFTAESDKAPIAPSLGTTPNIAANKERESKFADIEFGEGIDVTKDID